MRLILAFVLIGLLTGFIVNFFFADKDGDFSRITIENNTWNIEVAESLKDRIKGLSGRNNLKKDSGMLFIFSGSDFHSIWMKEMNFPIDIVWIDKNFKVVGLKNVAKPESYPEIFKPQSPARYVLEISAGEAKRAKIKIDSTVKIF